MRRTSNARDEASRRENTDFVRFAGQDGAFIRNEKRYLLLIFMIFK